MVQFTRDHWRWIGAAAAFGLAWAISNMTIFGVLFALPFCAIGALCLMKELTRPFTWIIDEVMGTTPGSDERPPIDLRLARFYVEKELLDDAIEEYTRVMRWHPAISEPYEEIMVLLARTGAPRKRIDQMLRRGRRHLRSPDARAALDRAYRQALETRPDFRG